MKSFYKRTNLLMLMAWLFSVSSFAQDAELKGTNSINIKPLKINESKAQDEKLKQSFIAYEIYKINTKLLDNLIKQQHFEFQLKLTLDQERSWDINLKRNNLKGASYQAVAQNASGQRVVEMPKACHTFAGYTSDNMMTRLNVLPNKLEGYIAIKDDYLQIRPLSDFIDSADADEYIIYTKNDRIQKHEHVCGVTHEMEQKYLKQSNISSKPGGNEKTGICYVLELATEADFEYYQNRGNSVAQANTDILGIVNLVEGLYMDEFALAIDVVFQRVWDDANDPYTVAGNSAAVIAELEDEWNTNMTGVARDLVHFWSGKNHGNSLGRVSALGQVCQNLALSYGFTVDHPEAFGTTAHEIGHNLSGVHGDGNNCGSGSHTTMCQGILTNLDFTNASVNRIQNYLDNNGACLENNNSLTSVFHFEGSNSQPETEFCDGDGIFLDGSASQFEDDYFIDAWRRPIGSTGSFDWVAGLGWTPGEINTIDLRLEFTLVGYTFTPGYEYQIKLATANNCIDWLETVNNFILEDYPIAEYHFENEAGNDQDVFCGGDEIFLNGTDSENEDKYFIDAWRRPIGSTGSFNWVSGLGWSQGEVGILNLTDLFDNVGYLFEPGYEYQIKLAVQNNCSDWEVTLNTFIIEPFATAEYHFENLAGNPQTEFCEGDDIILNGLDSEHELKYFIDAWRRPIGNTGSFNWVSGLGWNQGEVDVLNLTDLFADVGYTFVAGYEYQIKLAVQNDCTNWNEVLHEFTVLDGPELSLNIENHCEGDAPTVTVEVIDGVPPYTYAWTHGPTTATIIVDEPANGNSNANYLYGVLVTDGNGCTSIAKNAFTVYALPNVTVTTTPIDCDTEFGQICFNFADSPHRTFIEFSLGGTFLPAVSDASGSVCYNVFDGTYNLSARWGNTQCPIDLGPVTIDPIDEDCSDVPCCAPIPAEDINVSCVNDVLQICLPEIVGCEPLPFYPNPVTYGAQLIPLVNGVPNPSQTINTPSLGTNNPNSNASSNCIVMNAAQGFDPTVDYQINVFYYADCDGGGIPDDIVYSTSTVTFTAGDCTDDPESCCDVGISINSLDGCTFELCVDSGCPIEYWEFYGIYGGNIFNQPPGFPEGCVTVSGFSNGQTVDFDLALFVEGCGEIWQEVNFVMNCKDRPQYREENDFEMAAPIVVPNPFTDEFQIQLAVEKESDYQLAFYNLQGKEVMRSNGQLARGEHNILINELSDLPTGIYYYQMTVNDNSFSNKIVKE